MWLIEIYQNTIEDRDWLNNERNMLTEYNCSEAKGLDASDFSEPVVCRAERVSDAPACGQEPVFPEGRHHQNRHRLRQRDVL